MAVIRSFTGQYEFLSNGFPLAVHIPNYWDQARAASFHTFHTREAAFQATKTRSLVHVNHLISEFDPLRAIRYGRQIPLIEGWRFKRIDCMYNVVLRCVLQNENLAQALLQTANDNLAHGNNWGDTFWGVYYGKGDNHLGRILMHCRDLLRGPWITFKDDWQHEYLYELRLIEAFIADVKAKKIDYVGMYGPFVVTGRH